MVKTIGLSTKSIKPRSGHFLVTGGYILKNSLNLNLFFVGKNPLFVDSCSPFTLSIVTSTIDLRPIFQIEKKSKEKRP